MAAGTTCVSQATQVAGRPAVTQVAGRPAATWIATDGNPRVTIHDNAADGAVCSICLFDGNAARTAGEADTQVGSVINEVRGDGGDVIVSAGGYNGTKLGLVCGSASATAAAYQQVITKYGLHAMDFDLEEPEIESSPAIANELGAAQILQQDNPGLFVSVTMPSTTTGANYFGGLLLDEAKSLGPPVQPAGQQRQHLQRVQQRDAERVESHRLHRRLRQGRAGDPAHAPAVVSPAVLASALGELHRGGLEAEPGHVPGDEATDNGHEWTANQWIYDEVPGGPTGAWNDDGAC